MNEENDIDIAKAQAFLAAYYGTDHTELSKVSLVGEGAWSRCFGFRRGDQSLVIRFGNHVDDFQKDQRAYRYATSDLPIPEVMAIGQAFDGYYAISTRAYGVPLESLGVTAWRAIVPSVVSALETMRTTDLSSTAGIGGWGADETAPCASWSEHLLTVADDKTDGRTHGWREKLAASPQGSATFTWGFDLLKQVASDSVPHSLLHCDLINRNVLINKDRIAGVFDWGCARYGDHLYDLAWFEFWGPWYPELDMQILRSALEQRWQAVEYVPEAQDSRLLACYLHIGLDHLAYNAYLEDWDALLATAERMRELVSPLTNECMIK